MSTLDPPLALLAELTHRCPLRCPYCSNPLALQRASAELGTEAWRAILREAAELGVLQVHFSGGEPAARKDLEELVACASELGLYANLITSGLLLPAPRLKALAERGLRHVQLSFQDAEETSCDCIAGLSPAYRTKREVAAEVKRLGLALTVNAVVHRHNLERLGAMIELALELGAERLEVAHVQYYGWALKNRAALMPTRAQLEKATAVVEEAKARLKGALVFDYVGPDYYARRPKACMGGWGRRFIHVEPSGKVLPCHAAETIPGLAFERAGARPLAEIWRDSDAFRRFRGVAWMPEPCRSCPSRELDWGGCRCQALAFTGHAGDTDPACEFSPHHRAFVALAEAEAGRAPPAFDYRRMGAVS